MQPTSYLAARLCISVIPWVMVKISFEFGLKPYDLPFGVSKEIKDANPGRFE